MPTIISRKYDRWSCWIYIYIYISTCCCVCVFFLVSFFPLIFAARTLYLNVIIPGIVSDLIWYFNVLPLQLSECFIKRTVYSQRLFLDQIRSFCFNVLKVLPSYIYWQIQRMQSPRQQMWFYPSSHFVQTLLMSTWTNLLIFPKWSVYAETHDSLEHINNLITLMWDFWKGIMS